MGYYEYSQKIAQDGRRRYVQTGTVTMKLLNRAGKERFDMTKSYKESLK